MPLKITNKGIEKLRCPRCKQVSTKGNVAVTRRGKAPKFSICSDCGTAEAMFDLELRNKSSSKIVTIIIFEAQVKLTVTEIRELEQRWLKDG